LTIIAAAIGETLRNTLESTPKNLMTEVMIMIIEVVIIEAVDVINVRHNCLMPGNPIRIIT
jgi:hypothetical protein